MNYQVFVLESAFESISSLTPKRKKETLEFIRSLSTNPFHKEDFSEIDSSGRMAFPKSFIPMPLFLCLTMPPRK